MWWMTWLPKWRDGDTYYLLGSHLIGWSSNPATLATAQAPLRSSRANSEQDLKSRGDKAKDKEDRGLRVIKQSRKMYPKVQT